MVLGLHIMVNMLLNVTNLNKYGCALLYKAQEEADPLVAMPKKEGVPLEDSNIGGCVKRTINGESLAASVSNNEEQGGSSNNLDEAADNDMNELGMLLWILAWRLISLKEFRCILGQREMISASFFQVIHSFSEIL